MSRWVPCLVILSLQGCTYRVLLTNGSFRNTQPTVEPTAPTTSESPTPSPTPSPPPVAALNSAASWSVAELDAAAVTEIAVTLTGGGALTLDPGSLVATSVEGAASCTAAAICSQTTCTIRLSQCQGTGTLRLTVPALTVSGGGTTSPLSLPVFRVNNLTPPTLDEVAQDMPLVTVKGRCAPGATVRFSKDQTLAGETTCTSQGRFSFQGSELLARGVLASYTGMQTLHGMASPETSFLVSYDGHIVLGQSSYSGNAMLENGGMQYPSAVAIEGRRMAVADSGNHRVLIWNDFPNQGGRAPDLVLGQSTKSSGGSPTAPTPRNLYWPSGVALSDGKIIVADSAFNRILVWNSTPTEDGAPADVVLGQPDFTSSAANNGDRSAKSLSDPQSIAVFGSKLIASDGGNGRVLIWNNLPSQNHGAADVVVGQADFTSEPSDDISASVLGSRHGVAVVSGNLVVSDYYRNRVLIWNGIPNTNGAAATTVLGQPNFTTRFADNDSEGMSARTFAGPAGITSVGTKFAVADYGRGRVLVWNSLPTANHAAAHLVVGAPDFQTVGTDLAPTASAVGWPSGLASDGTALAVADLDFSRVLLWNALPSTQGAPSNAIFGPPFPDILEPNVAGSPARIIKRPQFFAKYGNNAFLSDAFMNRILVWSNFQGRTDEPATAVIGQSSLLTRTGSAATLAQPSGVWYDGNHTFVCDMGNHRVLMWNGIPSGSPIPDLILGQADANGTQPNEGGAASDKTLAYPYAVVTDGQKLYISDQYNNRVLIWNSIPTVTQQPADVVVGQPDFTTTTGATTASKLASSPNGIWVAEGKLIVADRYNSRVLIWNSIPTSNGAAADRVLGQTNFTSGNANAGGVSASSLSYPSGVTYGEDVLLVADFGNHRILGWRGWPQSDGQPADFVLGQPDFTSNSADRGLPVSKNGLYRPVGLQIENGFVWVTDSGNERVLRIPLPPAP